MLITLRKGEEKKPADNENLEIEFEVIAQNLEVPWDLDFAPDGRIFFTERPGRIRTIVNGKLDPDPWASLSVFSRGEAGLMGIAISPNFENNGHIYVYHTYRGPEDHIWNRIVRFIDKNNRGEFDKIILDEIPGGQIHDGGRVKFGPDGKLYVTTGDSGNSSLAQNLDSLAGKILRINADGSTPQDNPFQGSPIWSYGHRNPEGLTWHPETGTLYATEHGPSGHDELNVIEKGGNYGWPKVRGKSDGEDYIDPILESGSGTWAPSGTSFYSSNRIPTWKGNLFFVTLGFTPGGGRRSLHRVIFKQNNLRTVENHTILLESRNDRLRAVEEGPDGYLYITTSNRDGRGDPDSGDDRIMRIKVSSSKN
ncbi:hypothetical protein AKJ37_05710 [candidate division MSBL1 archaeon SCGC-AAA259I09]|uniref:Glucose/Sorbosone dehydrogenase domain-containing protein n=4 Tax=candidate division MSBL1 TaxID=215777 RepID=A0A133UND5_9EURY|nr:hypothetical protein AKJ66_03580 [candidate division MSBL1 archaeon SCGC-AAA259E22]KXA95744.1 hypothetical protein AKJ38_04335 [candidate division MSBL1 archaeon SCGC-AAA259I14]KXA96249.1 hypothetical protein AKJ37_05710 [candidate division MSBL1 archaeon SCGC-AAA259I09]KXA99467.1 hypothetical protein AKJ40_03070 [candidate division MSBL1 archaeon SCGC-AAA259M10]